MVKIIKTTKDHQKLDRIAQVIEDFMQLRLTNETLLPKELNDLRIRLGSTQLNMEAHDAAKYSLCHRVGSTLFQKENLTMGELSRMLSVPMSTATRMVDWLVENGFAVRKPDPDDRRVVRIGFTELGRRLYGAINNYMQERLDFMLSVLSAEELLTFLNLLHKVAVAMRKLNKDRLRETGD